MRPIKCMFGHDWGPENAICDRCGAEHPKLKRIMREHGGL